MANEIHKKKCSHSSSGLWTLLTLTFAQLQNPCVLKSSLVRDDEDFVQQILIFTGWWCRWRWEQGVVGRWEVIHWGHVIPSPHFPGRTSFCSVHHQSPFKGIRWWWWGCCSCSRRRYTTTTWRYCLTAAPSATAVMMWFLSLLLELTPPGVPNDNIATQSNNEHHHHEGNSRHFQEKQEKSLQHYSFSLFSIKKCWRTKKKNNNYSY